MRHSILSARRRYWRDALGFSVSGPEPLEQRIALSVSPSDAPAVISDSALPDSPIATPLHAGEEHFSGGVTVTDTLITTQTELIPRFVANPTITNIRSGSWTDPTIWSAGRVPTSQDRVRIAEDTSITYATQSDVSLNGLEINGSLTFATNVNTRLKVGNMTVMPTGTLNIGTAAAPVAAGVTAELIIADQALDLANDPRQYGTGLIVLGTINIRGAAPNATWTGLASEPRAGATSFFISGDSPTWKSGDTLVLPDTRQVAATDQKAFDGDTLPPNWETVVVDRVVGKQVFLRDAIKFDHLGARNTSGQIEAYPDVALLTRNVIVRSENPQGTRGHVFFVARASVDVEYARFLDLGRTDAMRPLDNTTFDANGNVTHYGTNQVGRYALHVHHVMGPENATNTGYQFQFVGNTIENARKWAMAVHDSSFGLIADNVVYGAQGAGFVTEEGTEIGNLFRHNIAIRIQGTHQDGKDGTAENDYGRGGSGFWFRRGGNLVVGNVAADATYAGFVIDGYSNYDPLTLPAYRGADKTAPGGSYVAALSPATTWGSNTAYGLMPQGLWLSYISGSNALPNQPAATFTNMRIWNVHNAGVMAYHTANVRFNNLLIIIDVAAQNTNTAIVWGLNLRAYENYNFIMENSRIEGARVGIGAPTGDASQPGAPVPTIIRNSTLRNYINIMVTPAQDSRPGNGNWLDVRNVKFSLITTIPTGPTPPSQLDPPANIQMRNTGDNLAVTQPSVVRVYDYNGNVGDNFQVFYREQTANSTLPGTDPSLLVGQAEGPIGSRYGGLSNSLNWSVFGIAFAGAIAPANATTRLGINGLVSSLVNYAAVTPRVILVTPWDNVTLPNIQPVRLRYNVDGLLPAGALVWFSVDGAAPSSRIIDGGFYKLQAGLHTVYAYIGDSQGRLLAGTISATARFTILPAASPSVMPTVVTSGAANGIVSALASSAPTTTAAVDLTDRSNSTTANLSASPLVVSKASVASSTSVGSLSATAADDDRLEVALTDLAGEVAQRWN